MSGLLERVKETLGEAVLDTHDSLGDATLLLAAEGLVESMRALRDEPELRFNVLLDLTAVDYLGRTPRFEVVYHLYSVARNQRVRVKTGVSEARCEIASAVGVWPAANWLEREVWDLYGVRFAGHPDLRRLLLYEEFEGHPLRKDYPKRGRQPLVGPQN